MRLLRARRRQRVVVDGQRVRHLRAALHPQLHVCSPGVSSSLMSGSLMAPFVCASNATALPTGWPSTYTRTVPGALRLRALLVVRDDRAQREHRALRRAVAAALARLGEEPNRASPRSPRTRVAHPRQRRQRGRLDVQRFAAAADDRLRAAAHRAALAPAPRPAAPSASRPRRVAGQVNRVRRERQHVAVLALRRRRLQRGNLFQSRASFSPLSSSAQVMYAFELSLSSIHVCSARRLRLKPPSPSRCLSSHARVARASSDRRRAPSPCR